MTNKPDEKDTPPWLEEVPEDVDVGAAGLSGRRSLFITAFISLVLIVGFVSLITYFYTATNGEKPVPHVAAPLKPVKVPPKDPGGREFDHQDKQIFDIAAGKTVAETDSALDEKAEKPLEDLAANMAPAEPLPGGVTVKETQAETPEEGSKVGSKLAETPVQGQQRVEPQENTSPPVKDKPVAAATLQAGAADQTLGIYQLQLGAFSRKEGAEAAWKTALETAPVSLKALQPVYQPVNTGDRTLYRLRAGDVATRGEADTLCLEIRAKDLPCIVIAIRAEQAG